MTEKLEEDIKILGLKIFTLAKRTNLSLSKAQLTKLLIKTTMIFPEIKINLFRFIDVLPSLKSAESRLEHFKLYLFPQEDRCLTKLANFLLKSGTLRAKLFTIINCWGISQSSSVFIAGKSSQEATKKLLQILQTGKTFTVDLLGEYSSSEKESLNYLKRYLDCINQLEKVKSSLTELIAKNKTLSQHTLAEQQISVSVKLSALYAATSVLNFDKSVEILSARLKEIALACKRANFLLWVDAEDSATNQIILEVFKQVFSSPELSNFGFPGLVVQAYNKNCQARLDELLKYSQNRGKAIAIRLVKGAYWDHETVLAEQNGHDSPLYSEKWQSDFSFEQATRFLIDNHQWLLPAFGSHNVRSLSYACCYASSKGLEANKYEIQMLYGMADNFADAVSQLGFQVRLYVPLGELLPGMGYLVRRLLENTSNESFLRSSFDNYKDGVNLLRAPGKRE